MVMAKQAWGSVSPATLKNCWNPTGIQQPQLPKITFRHPHLSVPANLAAGWDIVTQFATGQWSLPEGHAHLQKCLGNHYVASEWNKSMGSVLRAEDNKVEGELLDLVAVGVVCSEPPETSALLVAINRNCMTPMSAFITSRSILTNKDSITNKTGCSFIMINLSSCICHWIKCRVKIPFFIQNSFPLCLILIYNGDV